MSTPIEPAIVTAAKPPKIRVLALIDGFNLYHSLSNFERGVDAADRARFQKYKWLCFTSLIKRFVAPHNEELIGVEYFTAYPTWDDAKRLRHATFVSAQRLRGVRVTMGEFKRKTVLCYAQCKQEFSVNVEKQTDINIATTMIDRAAEYDKLLLLTADSDQVPAIRLLKKLYPNKTVAMVFPVGRSSKELKQACDRQSFSITEEHLAQCQLPNPIPIMRNGKQVSKLVKPGIW
jgi:uncharacterized LabA/DUF88 family protein